MVTIRPDLPFQGASKNLLSTTASPDYNRAEQQFIKLLTTENLDRQVMTQPSFSQEFEVALEKALAVAYAEPSESPEAENRFLQRILYRINRLNFVWYKDLNEYINERSFYLQWVRDRIEAVWQEWELAQLDLENLQNLMSKRH